MLPEIKQALTDCTFYAIDCEMTGLFVSDKDANAAYLSPSNNNNNNNNTKPPAQLDDIEERYEEMVQSSQAFVINQFGLSAFIWNEIEAAWRPKTFNFYVFPRPFEDWQPQFLSEALSLDFLSTCGFDFNKWIYHGINCMPAYLRKTKLEDLAGEGDRNRRRRDLVLHRESDIEFVNNMISKITEWLASPETERGDSLVLPAVNSFQRAIQYQTLRNECFDTQPALGGDGPLNRGPGPDPDPDPFYVERIEIEDEGRRRPALRLVRASPQEIAEYEAQSRQQKELAVLEASAFVELLQAMRRSSKPVVGHNLAFDLAYTLQSFVSPLPSTWEEYQHRVRRWFPGGVYDTKHIARQMEHTSSALSLVFEDTGLGNLFTNLCPDLLPSTVDDEGGGEGAHMEVDTEDGGYRAFKAGADWKSTNNSANKIQNTKEGRERIEGALEFNFSDPSAVPPILHAPGYDRYSGVQVSAKAHEAGYDAFMTGAVFARLLSLLEANKRMTTKSNADIDELNMNRYGGRERELERERDSEQEEEEENFGPLSLNTPSPSMASVYPYCWRINVSKSDLPCAFLYPGNPSPPPSRPQVLFLSGLVPGKYRHGGVLNRTLGVDVDGLFGGKPLHVHLLEGRSTALVQLPQPRPLLITRADGGGDDGDAEAVREMEEFEEKKRIVVECIEKAVPGVVVGDFDAYRRWKKERKGQGGGCANGGAVVPPAAAAAAAAAQGEENIAGAGGGGGESNEGDGGVVPPSLKKRRRSEEGEDGGNSVLQRCSIM